VGRARVDLPQLRRHRRFENGGMKMKSWLCGILCAAATGSASLAAPAGPATPLELAAIFRTEVDRRLEVPPEEALRYGRLADEAFARAGVILQGAQYVAVIDRHERVQALLLMWRSGAGDWQLVGASPVSTGRPGSFDHFETPTGVFEHTMANPDFRAEGTFNSNGIRGYGEKGLRVFDFGWQRVAKGWGDGKVIEMRLQMHATDPDRLEQRRHRAVQGLHPHPDDAQPAAGPLRRARCRVRAAGARGGQALGAARRPPTGRGRRPLPGDRRYRTHGASGVEPAAVRAEIGARLALSQPQTPGA
jgi:hypothetical protein